MKVTRKEIAASTFRPFVVRIKVSSEKDLKILKSLFARMQVVPDLLEQEGHLSAYNVSKDELHDFMTSVYDALDA